MDSALETATRRTAIATPARSLGLVLSTLLFHTAPGVAAETVDNPPPLVVLTETGETRGELPVFALHPEPEPALAVLGRGLSSTLLRVYAMTQRYLENRTGAPAEPAYILLSQRQGGYARVGFYLGDEEKADTGYVDVHRDWPLAGSFGAIDQLFPHELAHVMRRQLVGELGDGGANQVHALGLRTDRVTAFNEGYAEHLQALAIDHPDADPTTAALASELDRYRAAQRRLSAYRRELEAAWSPAARMRLGFVAWYSNDEDVLRYFAVSDNVFSRRPSTPDRLRRARDPYRAYLIEGTALARPSDSAESLPRRLAKEGVVAALFYRWAHSELLRSQRAADDLYELFGVTAEEIGPLENLYLKLVHAQFEHRPQDAMTLVFGYRESFPTDAAEVDRLCQEVLGTSSVRLPPEIWLANPSFETGTTLFDQFRGLPRIHTFDLNAASPVDLASVRGVDPDLARSILAAAPYTDLAELGKVGVSTPVLARFEQLAAEMARLREDTTPEDAETVISLEAILLPYLWRALLVLLVSSLVASLLYRAVRHRLARPPSGRVPWWRCGIVALVASLVGLVAGWLAGPAAGLGSVAAVTLLFGLPAALLERRSSTPRSWGVAAAWLAAALPAAAAVTPLL